MSNDRGTGVERFWDTADHSMALPGVSRSTMMGLPCLRLDGDFFASWDPHRDALVIKLARADIDVMLAEGSGEPFAPNGRRFREWASISSTAIDRWPRLLEAAFEHVQTRRAGGLDAE